MVLDDNCISGQHHTGSDPRTLWRVPPQRGWLFDINPGTLAPRDRDRESGSRGRGQRFRDGPYPLPPGQHAPSRLRRGVVLLQRDSGCYIQCPRILFVHLQAAISSRGNTARQASGQVAARDAAALWTGLRRCTDCTVLAGLSGLVRRRYLDPK